MKNFDCAIKKEVNKEFTEAVKLYEEELKNNVLPSINTYINLAFLYWEFASEFGFVTYYEIPDSWREIGDARHPIIVEDGLQKYPKSIELHFWRRYFRHRLFFEDFTPEECEELIREYGDEESLVPYFFLYLFDEDKYRQKRDELRKRCKELATAKNLYILSFN